tara:strand:- start:3016 stop:4041 length:1026 start_codon:yes stop_codon:yes gene_type:complete
MLDINGDLTEAIDSQINEVVIENVFLKALKSDPESEQGGPFEGYVGKLMGDELIGEVFGLVRLYALVEILAPTKGKTFKDLAGVDFERYTKSKMEEIFDEFSIDDTVDDIDKMIQFDKEQAERIIKRETQMTTRGLSNLFGISRTRSTPAPGGFGSVLPENLLPSSVITKMSDLHSAITNFLNKNISKVDKEVKKTVKTIGELIKDKNQELIDDLETITASRTASSGTLPENINEEQLVTTVIDLEKLKSEEMNEIFLAQLGGAIELVLGFMFDSKPLPLSVTGAPRDVSAFARTIGSEKKYIEAARQYGLDHPSTYKNRAKLTNAIRKFEKQTGIKWPFK